MRLLSFTCFLLLISSCINTIRVFDPNDWYIKIKMSVLKESDEPSATSSIEFWENNKIKSSKSFINGRHTVDKFYRVTGELIAETHYSKDGQFELRRELCPNGTILFEGLFYKKHACGPSTWLYCDNSKEEEGIRYGDNKIGVWKKWDKDGEVVQTDYKNENLLDSIKAIKYN